MPLLGRLASLKLCPVMQPTQPGLLAIAALGLLLGLLTSCSPPRTAADAERCRMEADREHAPGLIAEAINNCPNGGRLEACVSAASLQAYYDALVACRESK